jgi:hypothetical protein
MNKYQAGDSDATQWRSDERLIFATWRTKPFHGARHRNETVEHRIVVEYTHEIGVDLLHECRSEDTGKFADDWEVVESVEVREYGARYEKAENARYLS